MEIEEVLYQRYVDASRGLKGTRKPFVNDIFKRVAYLAPQDFIIENYKRPHPAVAFNPGAFLKGNDLYLFPRFIFDYYKYTSSVGLAVVNVEELFEGKLGTPFKSQIILWPQHLWEFLGCEDARALSLGEQVLLLYTGKGLYRQGDDLERRDVLGFAVYDRSWQLQRRGYFAISDGDTRYLPHTNKDSAFIEIRGNDASMLTRPEIRGRLACWRGFAKMDTLEIQLEGLEPVLFPEGWELKVGWSTNVVKLSSNEYLVGWHGVLWEDYSYRNGLALVDGQGNLLAVSDYLLAPKGINEEYGDRALVIFGDGLVRYKEYLVWIGGVSDYAIGIFAVELEKALEKVRWLTG